MGKRRASARHACHSWWRPTGGGIPSVTWPPRGLHPSNERPPSTHLSRAQHRQASGAGESIRYQRSRGPKNPAPGPQPRFPGEHPRPPPFPRVRRCKGPCGVLGRSGLCGPSVAQHCRLLDQLAARRGVDNPLSPPPSGFPTVAWQRAGRGSMRGRHAGTAGWAGASATAPGWAHVSGRKGSECSRVTQLGQCHWQGPEHDPLSREDGGVTGPTRHFASFLRARPTAPPSRLSHPLASGGFLLHPEII